MATVQEPYVIIQEEIIPQAASVVGNTAMITAGVVVSNLGPITPTLVQTQTELLTNYTLGGKITANDHTTLKNAYRLLASAPVYLARSVNSTATLAPTSNDGVIIPVNARTLQTQSFTSVVELTVDTTAVPTDGLYRLVIGPYEFRHDPAGVIVDDSGNTNVIIDWNGDFQTGLAAAANSAGVDVTFVFVSATPQVPTTTIKYNYTIYTNFEIESITATPNTYITAATVVSSVASIPTGEIPAFVLIPKSVASIDNITVNYALPVSPNPNRVIIQYNGTDYLISMDRDDIDSNGSNIYLTYLNNLTDLPFTIQVLNETGFDAFTAQSNVVFGKGINYTAVASATADNMIQAVQSFNNQEEQSLTFFCDFNFTNVAFQSAINAVAANNYAFPVFSIPTSITNAQLAINYRNQTGINTNAAYFITPNDISSSIFAFSTDFAAGVVYIETVIANANKNFTYAGAFGSKNGSVSISALTKNYKKEDRQLMAGSQINTIIVDNVNGVNYISNNLTADQSTTKNVMQEENNRRLALRINRDAVTQMVQFIGEQNNSGTQKKVRDMWDSYFTQNIMNQNYRPEEYQVICDDTNNTTAIKNANGLAVTIKVRYRYSIKYITVLHQIYAIGTAF